MGSRNANGRRGSYRKGMVFRRTKLGTLRVRVIKAMGGLVL